MPNTACEAWNDWVAADIPNNKGGPDAVPFVAAVDGAAKVAWEFGVELDCPVVS